MISRFGEMIGNTDMHLGNASLIGGDQAPHTLAPVYDMLPMRWRPAATGEVMPYVDDVDATNWTPPLPQETELWLQAATLAQTFFVAVARADTSEISATFQQIMQRQSERLTRMQQQMAR
jgi:hypothetical protein